MRGFLAVALAAGLGLAAAGPAAADIIYTTGDNGTDLAHIDTVTGAGANLGDTGYGGVWALAIDNADGTMYTTVNWGQYLGKFNSSTGAVTLIGSSHSATTLIALEIADDGTLYGADWNGGLWTISKTTGVRTYVGGGGVNSVMDLAFDSSGTLWGTANNRLYTINTSTGAATFVTNMSGIPGGVMGIMFDEDDVLFATPWISNAGLYSVSTSTGAATFVGNTGLYYPHGGDILVVLDHDGDGIPDDEDHCPDSDLSATVVIDGCDSGVANTLFDTGCTISDLIAECAASATNHGDFVSCVAHLTNGLKNDGILTGKQKSAIQKCAAQSSIGK